METNNSSSLMLNTDDDQKSKNNNKSLMKLDNISVLEKSNSFLKLTKFTDLNNISDNWFWKSQFINYFTKWTHKKQSDIFSSLKMAEKYVDDNLIGDIDVVTEAEIIKQLLKIPFNKSSQMSLMVHRIGNTLFIDEFDIHKYLIRMEKNEWDWLKKFYYETVLQALAIKQLTRQCKSREALQDRDLLLKFLCCSLGKDTKLVAAAEVAELNNNKSNKEFSAQPKASNDYLSDVFWTFDNMKMLIGSNLPIFGDETRPAVTLRLRDMRKPISILTGLDYWLDNLICNIPELHMCYHLDGIVQDYEVIRTEDIPYLSGSEFPPGAIKTIAKNILSFLKSNVTKEGHTYWLFKGPGDEIVKLYDLTSLCDDHLTDKYDNAYTVPVAMLLYKVAQNMIKNNETKDVDTISKLLRQCLEMLNKTKHPEVYSKACYLICDLYLKDNVFENLNSASECHSSDSKFKNESSKANGNSKKPAFDKNISKPQTSTLKAERVLTPTLELGSLICKESHQKSKKYEEKEEKIMIEKEIKTLTAESSIEEKSKFSIKYLTQGYEALELSEHAEKKSDYVENTEKFARPEKVIPLNFQVETRSENNIALNIKTNNAFKKLCHNKGLILQKLISAYYCLAVSSSKNLNYGHAFQYMNIAVDLYFARCKVWPFDKNSDLKKILYYLISLCGDCRLLVASKLQNSEENFKTYLNQFNSVGDYYDKIVIEKANVILNEGEIEDYSRVKSFFSIQSINDNVEQNFFITLNAYNYALSQLEENKREEVLMKKRLANLKNELGTFYLNICSKLMKYEEENLSLLRNIERFLQKSYEYFLEGIKCFEEIDDYSNCALLTANCAKLMRIYSKFYTEEFFLKLKSPENGDECDTETQKKKVSLLFDDLSTNFEKYDKTSLYMKEKSCLSKAIEFYTKATKFIDNPNRMTNETKLILNSIYWDLSSTCFNLACLLQDYAPSVLVYASHDEIEKEITDYMNRAINYLKNISFEPNNTSELSRIEYRLATIHHRLASLYHHSLRNNQNNETKKKHMKSLAEIHYAKAFQYYNTSNSVSYVCEKLRILLEEVALSEFYFEGLTSLSSKIKCLEGCLKLFYKCKECLTAIILEMKESCCLKNEDFQRESNKLTKIFIQRIQFSFKNAIKLLTSKKNKNSNEQKQLDDIKLLYMKSLNEFDFKKYQQTTVLNEQQDDLQMNFDVEFYERLTQYLDQINKLPILF